MKNIISWKNLQNYQGLGIDKLGGVEFENLGGVEDKLAVFGGLEAEHVAAYLTSENMSESVEKI